MNKSPDFGKEILTGIGQILSKCFSDLAADEIKNVTPDLVNFFTWLSANPTAIGNPAAIVPKLIELKVAVLSAQSSIASENVKEFSDSILSLLNGLMVQVQNPSAPDPVISGPV